MFTVLVPQNAVPILQELYFAVIISAILMDL